MGWAKNSIEKNDNVTYSWQVDILKLFMNPFFQFIVAAAELGLKVLSTESAS